MSQSLTQSLTHSQALLASDPVVAGRVAAVLVSESIAYPTDVLTQAWAVMPWFAAQPGMAAAYHAALLAGRQDAGSADDVITDAALAPAVVAAVGAQRAAG